jgi:AAA domain
VANDLRHDPIHILLYGRSGTGKTRFLSTMPTPGITFQFDPPDKSGPLLRAGVPGDLTKGEFGPFREVKTEKGELLWRIEYFHELGLGRTDVKKKATAYDRFLLRMNTFYGELKDWQTAAIDSVTFMELCARKKDQYVMNATARDPRQWYAASTEAVEEMVMMVFANLPMNIVVIAHAARENKYIKGASDSNVQSIQAPGRLALNVPSGFGETYRAYVEEDENGRTRYRLQTRLDGDFTAGTQIGAPNPCRPRYASLWEREQPAQEAEPEGVRT